MFSGHFCRTSGFSTTYNSCHLYWVLELGQTREVPPFSFFPMQGAFFCFSAVVGLLLACILVCRGISPCKHFKCKHENVFVVVHTFAFGGRGIFTTTEKIPGSSPHKSSNRPLDWPDGPRLYPDVDLAPPPVSNLEPMRAQFIRCKHKNYSDKRKRELPLIIFLFFVVGLSLM